VTRKQTTFDVYYRGAKMGTLEIPDIGKPFPGMKYIHKIQLDTSDSEPPTLEMTFQEMTRKVPKDTIGLAGFSIETLMAAMGIPLHEGVSSHEDHADNTICFRWFILETNEIDVSEQIFDLPSFEPIEAGPIYREPSGPGDLALTLEPGNFHYNLATSPLPAKLTNS